MDEILQELGWIVFVVVIVPVGIIILSELLSSFGKDE